MMDPRTFGEPIPTIWMQTTILFLEATGVCEKYVRSDKIIL